MSWITVLLYLVLAWAIICGILTGMFFFRIAYTTLRERLHRRTGSSTNS